MEAIILAGGLGTRLRAAVPDLPKPMAPVSGRPFLEHQFDYWVNQGVSRFILSVGYRHDAISAHFGAAYRGIPVVYAIESRPLGTGGGLMLAMRSLSATGPFLVLNGDTYFEVALGALREFHAEHEADITLSLFRTQQQGRYTGLGIGAAGEVVSLNAGEKGGLANGGVYLVERRLLDREPGPADARVSFEEDILPSALRSGKRMFGLEFSGRFIDIGVPEDYARASALLGA